MPLTPSQPPEGLLSLVAGYVHELATPSAGLPALHDVAGEDVALVLPHRTFTVGVGDIFEAGTLDAKPSGWRFLITDKERVIASAEVPSENAQWPAVNSGPFVRSTAEAIKKLETLPEVSQGQFEVRILDVPALYVRAIWLIGARRIVVPLAPAPLDLHAGELYSEEDFLAELRGLAQGRDLLPDE